MQIRAPSPLNLKPIHSNVRNSWLEDDYTGANGVSRDDGDSERNDKTANKFRRPGVSYAGKYRNHLHDSI